ncbi:hypothetical protein J6590_021732 [Homalodisca vitripennis]|nr:hypothetical protein J6590_021732 [Homalodisca vitripennis]
MAGHTVAYMDCCRIVVDVGRPGSRVLPDSLVAVDGSLAPVPAGSPRLGEYRTYYTVSGESGEC